MTIESLASPPIALPSDTGPAPSREQASALSDDDDDDVDSPTIPTFTFPSAPPQIESLSLPSPSFASASFSDLLAPLTLGLRNSTSSSSISSGQGPARRRTSSRLSTHQDQPVHQQPRREPTLIYSIERPKRDDRVRREGKLEELFYAPYPEHELNLPADEDDEWLDEDWAEVVDFLLQRGYKIERDVKSSMTSKIPALRISDSLPLHLHLVRVHDDSFELDCLEHLSSAGVLAHARAQGLLPMVPIVGLVPMSADWTACLKERFDTPDLSRISDPAQLVKQLVGTLAFLHSNHIAHLALSPTTLAIASSPDSDRRYTLDGFENSILLDPLSKNDQLVTGAGEGMYSAPEMSADKAYDPKRADIFSVAVLLKEVLTKRSALSPEMSRVLEDCSAKDAKERPADAVQMNALLP